MAVPTRRILDPMFGEASLVAANNADATWVRGIIPPHDQKGSTGWLANLYGGVQTGDDWARVNIPVGELRVPDFNSALWSYYMTSTQTMGIGIVIWLHDPNDFNKRCEVTQLANVSGLEKGAGFNAHEFDKTVTQMFFYGEGTGASALTAGTQYTWNQFQTDVVFKTWTIYRITFDYGWEASGTFDDAWVADIKLNGLVVRLRPDSGGSGRIGRRYKTATSGNPSFTLAPKTPYKLLSFTFHLDSAATQDPLTVTVDAGRAALYYDTLLLSQDMSGIRDIVQTWEGGLDLKEDDEVVVSWANGDSRDYGLTLTYQTVGV